MGMLFLVQPSQWSLGAGLVVSNKSSIWASSYIALCGRKHGADWVLQLHSIMEGGDECCGDVNFSMQASLCGKMHRAELPRWMCKIMC